MCNINVITLKISLEVTEVHVRTHNNEMMPAIWFAVALSLTMLTPTTSVQRHCFYNGKTYDHLEEYTPRECIKCTCLDGHMTCDRQTECPALNCPVMDQVAVEGECCKFCKGADYCGQGNNCHQKATCYNLDTRFACQCHDGYDGDGVQCEDIDECLIEGGHYGHHCHSNTLCINSPGSYECECLPGFVRESAFACQERDECALGLDDCHINAYCINVEGSYTCECMLGYQGDGLTCQPVCRHDCDNGGTCVAPDTCDCRRGYIGNHCQTDLDECETGHSHCHPNSECVNIPGHYYCRCKRGYHSNHHDNLNGLLCRDVDECQGWGQGHQCPVGTECINVDGGYVCVCQQQESCYAACQVDGEFHANGTAWTMQDDQCSECVCKEGEVRCSKKQCECGTGYDDPTCCPQCDVGQRCEHQILPITYYNGDTWIYQCQTCECLHGEVDCWALRCPSLSCSKIIHENGDCCPRCMEDDPCQAPLHAGLESMPSPMSTVCFFDGRRYVSGDQWAVSWDMCSGCTCQAGQICCKYNETCAAVRLRNLLLSEQQQEAANQMFYYADQEDSTEFNEPSPQQWSKLPTGNNRRLRQGASHAAQGLRTNGHTNTQNYQDPRFDRIPGSVLDPYLDDTEEEEPDEQSGYFANPGTPLRRTVAGSRRTLGPQSMALHNIPGGQGVGPPASNKHMGRQSSPGTLYNLEGVSEGHGRSSVRTRTLGRRKPSSSQRQGSQSLEPYGRSADLSQISPSRASHRRKNSRRRNRQSLRRSKSRQQRAVPNQAPVSVDKFGYQSRLEAELADTVATADRVRREAAYSEVLSSLAQEQHNRQLSRRRRNFDGGG